MSKYGGSILKAIKFLDNQAMGIMPVIGFNYEGVDFSTLVNPLRVAAVYYKNQTFSQNADSILKKSNKTESWNDQFNDWILTV